MYYKALSEKRRGLDRYALFRALACDLADTGYVWGGEDLKGVDCSGSVCVPLIAMNYDIRLPASALLDQLFIHRVAGFHDQHVAAAFVLADTRRYVGDKWVEGGAPTHVMPVVGEGCVLDAMWGGEARIRSHQAVIAAYGEGVVYRAMDWGALERMDGEGSWLWGVSPQTLKDLRGWM